MIWSWCSDNSEPLSRDELQWNQSALKWGSFLSGGGKKSIVSTTAPLWLFNSEKTKQKRKADDVFIPPNEGIVFSSIR